MNLQPFLFHPSSSYLTTSTMVNLLQGMPLKWVSDMNHTISYRFLSIGSFGLFGMVFSALKMTPSLWSFSPSLQLWKTFARLFQGLPSLRRIFSRPPYDNYMSSEEEEKGRGAQATRLDVVCPPLVMYYTPALLPEYRDAPRKKKEVKRYYISAKNYCKWHWMVFSGDDHPTIAEANKLRNLHSASELRMIDHIARMLPDDKVFSGKAHRARPWTPKYEAIWLAWFRSAERKAERS
ncbi:hypothetical protein BJ912DRAFT_1095821 [Pholiota molesta]|nr:hypothetical protein BJ912DRAFT_1095821 [Pholiota molesta]